MTHGSEDCHRPPAGGVPPAHPGLPPPRVGAAAPYGGSPSSAGYPPGTPRRPPRPRRGTDLSQSLPCLRPRGVRGVALGLLALVAGTGVAVVLCLLPPHNTVLRLVGAGVGLLGVLVFGVLAAGGRSIRNTGLGLLLGCGLMAAVLYAFEDTALSLGGVRDWCTVTGVAEHGRTKGGGPRYGYHLRCPGGVTSMLRDQPPGPPDRVLVVYHPDELVEAQRPGDVTPGLSLAGTVVCGAGCVGWALLGLRRRGG